MESDDSDVWDAFDCDSNGESENENEDTVTKNDDTKPTPKTDKSTKGLRHLNELKNTLGLVDFQDKAELKREKRRRQKARRKLKKTEGSGNAQIQTKATKLKETAAKVIPEVVTYLDPKKRAKTEQNDKRNVPKKVEDSANTDDSEVTMKQAR